MNTKALDKMLSGIELFRQLDTELPTQTVAAFLIIAMKPGITISELAERLGLAVSSASRNVSVLSEWMGFQKAGHNIISVEVDPQNRRVKRVSLNAKGKRLAESLTKVME